MLLSKFKEICNRVDGIRYYGSYNKGYGEIEIAFVYGDEFDLVQLAIEVTKKTEEDQENLFDNKWHENNLGKSLIASFKKEYFEIDCEVEKK